MKAETWKILSLLIFVLVHEIHLDYWMYSTLCSKEHDVQMNVDQGQYCNFISQVLERLTKNSEIGIS